MARGDRISVEQRAAILAEYANSGSYERAAKAGGVCAITATGLIKDNLDVVEATKKTAQERMQHYMESRLARVQLSLDKIIDDMPNKLDKANALQAATVLGILMDKFGGQRDFNGNAVQVNVTFGGGQKDSLEAFK